EIAIAKRLLASVSLQAAIDRARSMNPSLHRDLGHPREMIQRHHVANHEDLGMTRQGAVGQHLDVPRAIGLRTRRFGEYLPQRRGLDAGSPDLCAAGDAFLAIWALNDDLMGGDVRDPAVHSQLDARVFDLARGDGAELVAEGGQRLLAAVEEDHLP